MSRVPVPPPITTVEHYLVRGFSARIFLRRSILIFIVTTAFPSLVGQKLHVQEELPNTTTDSVIAVCSEFLRTLESQVSKCCTCQLATVDHHHKSSLQYINISIISIIR